MVAAGGCLRRGPGPFPTPALAGAADGRVRGRPLYDASPLVPVMDASAMSQAGTPPALLWCPCCCASGAIALSCIGLQHDCGAEEHSKSSLQLMMCSVLERETNSVG